MLRRLSSFTLLAMCAAACGSVSADPDARVDQIDATITAIDAMVPDAPPPDAALCVPVDCDDNDTCTEDICNDGTCENSPITACVDGDGCCPAGCRHQTDGDCPVSALLLGVDGAGFATTVQTALQATGLFATVDTLSLQTGLPTLADLQVYDVVVLYSDNVFPDPVGLGDVLADYFDPTAASC